MSTFNASPKLLKELLSKIESKDLALPDFQRDFVWDPGATAELIESIIKSYPAGSLLFLDHNGLNFQIREFEGAPKYYKSEKCKQIVLDGQQRLTSLYQAFYGKGDHQFFIKLNNLLDTQDTDGAIVYEKTSKAIKKGMMNITYQARNNILPLSVIFGNQEGFHQWQNEILQTFESNAEKVIQSQKILSSLYNNWISKIVNYQFPVVILDSSTPLEAVCKMFETLNRRGVKLTVFELLMARSFSENVSLRSLWDKAKEEHPLLEKYKVDPYYLLQTISLICKNSIKRKDVLDLEPHVIKENWSPVVSSVNDALTFMHTELGILSPEWMPYKTMLIPSAALFAKINKFKGPKIYSSKIKIKRWFWASVFSQTYEVSPTSRAVSDFKQVMNWITNDSEEPTTIKRFFFDKEDLYSVTPKQRGLYKGVIALICSGGAVDFHNGERLSFEYLVNNKVDDHHIYPKSYLSKYKIPEVKINCVLNRTLIDASTNRRINNKKPSIYASEILNELKSKKTNEILKSHLIEAQDLENNNYDNFLENRLLKIFELLEKKYEAAIPNTKPENFDDLYEDEIDDREISDPRDKLTPEQINPFPKERVAKYPEHLDLYNAFVEKLSIIAPDVWWKTRTNKLSYFSPSKNFMTMKISTHGLNIVLYTRGLEIKGVSPILQKDNGGSLWGRIKLKDLNDIDVVFNAIKASSEYIKEAERAGEATGWWANSKASA